MLLGPGYPNRAAPGCPEPRTQGRRGRGNPSGRYLQHPVCQHLPHVRLDFPLHALEVGGAGHVALLQAEQTLQDTLVAQQPRVRPGPGRVPGALAAQQLHTWEEHGQEWSENSRVRTQAAGQRAQGAGLVLVLALALSGGAPTRPRRRARRFPDRRPSPRDDVATVECSNVTTFQGAGLPASQTERAGGRPPPPRLPRWSAGRGPAGFREPCALRSTRGASFPGDGPLPHHRALPFCF